MEINPELEAQQQNEEEQYLQEQDDQQLPEGVGEENIEDDVMPKAEPEVEDATPSENDKSDQPPNPAENFPAHGNDQEQADEQPDAAEELDQKGQDDDFRDLNDYDEDIFNLKLHKTGESGPSEATKKKKIRRAESTGPTGTTQSSEPPAYEYEPEYGHEDALTRKRRILEERMDQAMKTKTVRRKKADEDDLERMQDDKIDLLKTKMIEAANLDVEKNLQGQIATEKLKLLKEVMDTMLKADLAILILDNNLLEAVRLWLEPLPDASMPAYQIQKELLHALATLPIKTDHLVASGIGKVLVFYQKSSRTEANLKKIVDRLIGDWTRPILNKSDSYKDRTIRFHDYNKSHFVNQLLLQRRPKAEPKTLYEQQAERRNRAAIPLARTTAYKIAPKVDPSLLMKNARGDSSERFSRINRKMTNLKKKTVKKGGPSIEGKNLSI